MGLIGGNERQILDPAGLADTAALRFMQESDTTDAKERAVKRLNHLDGLAASFGFIGQSYWVESGRALSIPSEFDVDDDEVRVIDFSKLNFEGTFACYSKVVVGQILGRVGVGKNVDALCLTFHETTLLPFMDELPDDHMLYVPVMAVQTMGRTDRLPIEI